MRNIHDDDIKALSRMLDEELDTIPDDVQIKKTRHKKDRAKTPLTKQNSRTCIATRDTFLKSQLFRFVVGPENVLYFDVNNKLPGRGMWVSMDKKALESAIKKNLFAKSAKTKVIIPTNLQENMEKILRKQMLQMITLANKSGIVVCGFDKTYEQLKRNPNSYHYYLQAHNCAKNGAEKITNLIEHIANIKVVKTFSSQELSSALGRENVVHALIQSGSFSKNIKIIYTKLLLFK